MKAKQILSIAIVSGIGFLGANTGLAQDTTDSIKAINSATQQLAEGNVEEALQGFDSAAEASADNHTLSYNRGIALYRNGDIEAARAQFVNALNSTDSTLAAKSWFNLGNCDYSNALAGAEQDRPAAIKSLKNSIQKYRRSLRLNSDDTDARANIELAARLMNQLQQQEEQEQQQEQEKQEKNRSRKNKSSRTNSKVKINKIRINKAKINNSLAARILISKINRNRIKVNQATINSKTSLAKTVRRVSSLKNSQPIRLSKTKASLKVIRRNLRAMTLKRIRLSKIQLTRLNKTRLASKVTKPKW